MYRSCAITDVVAENYRTRALVFDHPLPSEPGQFVMVWLPGVGERPYSIAGANPFRLMVVAVGPFSEALHALQPGERVWIRGPLGQGFRLPDGSGDGPESPGEATGAESASRSHVLLAGGGYGVAPLHYLARQAVRTVVTVDVCIGAATADDVLLSDAFRSLGASVQVTTDDGSLGRRGLVTLAVEQAIASRRPDTVYACGPTPMLEALESLCRAREIPHQLSWEARMRCGMGLCGACEVHGRDKDGWLACTDGPVASGS